MIWRGLIFDPYLDAAMGVNVVILGLCGYALENRRLFTAPLLMSVTTAVCLIFTAMVFHVCADDDLVFYICMIYSVILVSCWLAFVCVDHHLLGSC